MNKIIELLKHSKFPIDHRDKTAILDLFAEKEKELEAVKRAAFMAGWHYRDNYAGMSDEWAYKNWLKYLKQNELLKGGE